MNKFFSLISVLFLALTMLSCGSTYKSSEKELVAFLIYFETIDPIVGGRQANQLSDYYLNAESGANCDSGGSIKLNYSIREMHDETKLYSMTYNINSCRIISTNDICPNTSLDIMLSGTMDVTMDVTAEYGSDLNMLDMTVNGKIRVATRKPMSSNFTCVINLSSSEDGLLDGKTTGTICGWDAKDAMQIDQDDYCSIIAS